MNKYFYVWSQAVALSIQVNLEQRFGALIFILGKFIRFGILLLVLITVSQRVQHISGYTTRQMITFFLIFNFFDLLAQIFFRGIYWFRNQIISGEFDFTLLKPLNPLFFTLTRHTDILDIPLFILVIFLLLGSPSGINTTTLIPLLIIFLCALLIITAIHIFVAAFGIITTEVDHTIMIFRDLSAMARVPTDIYALPIRILLSIVIPITISFTLPAKALMGLITPTSLALAVSITLIFCTISIFIWSRALRHYTSASS